MAAQVVADNGSHLLRVKPGLFIDNITVRIDKISVVGRRAVGAPEWIVYLVNQHQGFQVFRLIGFPCQGHPVFIGQWLEYRIPSFVRAELFGPYPLRIRTGRTGRVSLDGVNNNDMEGITVLIL